MVLDCLSTECSDEGARALQTGAMLSVLDAYDRECLRDNFIPILYSSLALHTAMGRLSTIAAVRRLLDSNQLSVGKLDEAVNGISHFATDQKIVLKGLVERLSQCPKAADTIS